MAQGAVKKAPRASLGSKAKQPHKPKKGARVTKPQKAKSSSTDKIIKKFSSGMIAKTEAMLGEKARHLELIGKGKKAEKSDGNGRKGGSRKFG